MAEMTDAKLYKLQESVLSKCGKIAKEIQRRGGAADVIYFQDDVTGECVVYTPWARDAAEIKRKLFLNHYFKIGGDGGDDERTN